MAQLQGRVHAEGDLLRALVLEHGLRVVLDHVSSGVHEQPCRIQLFAAALEGARPGVLPLSGDDDAAGTCHDDSELPEHDSAGSG